jgi:hypothetical protein
MRTITVCTLTLGLMSSSFAFAAGTATAPAATGKTAPAATTAPAAAPTAAPAATTAPADKPASTMTAKSHPAATATGEVTALDVKKNLLTIKETDKSADFEILPSTKVTSADGKAGKEADVKVGAKVTVTYSMHGKTMVAKSVKIG